MTINGGNEKNLHWSSGGVAFPPVAPRARVIADYIHTVCCGGDVGWCHPTRFAHARMQSSPSYLGPVMSRMTQYFSARSERTNDTILLALEQTICLGGHETKMLITDARAICGPVVWFASLESTTDDVDSDNFHWKMAPLSPHNNGVTLMHTVAAAGLCPVTTN